MPIVKNTSDHDVSGIVGIGLIKPGEIKIVGDPIEHPDLKMLTMEEIAQLPESELNQLYGVEPDQESDPVPSTPLPPALPPQPPTPPATAQLAQTAYVPPTPANVNQGA